MQGVLAEEERGERTMNSDHNAMMRVSVTADKTGSPKLSEPGREADMDVIASAYGHGQEGGAVRLSLWMDEKEEERRHFEKLM